MMTMMVRVQIKASTVTVRNKMELTSESREPEALYIDCCFIITIV